jgi:hypothetical protein
MTSLNFIGIEDKPEWYVESLDAVQAIFVGSTRDESPVLFL